MRVVGPRRSGIAQRKLSMPRLGRVFDRNRLFGLLEDLHDSPAIWVGAPPGSGKTALVATWLRHSRGARFWLQLDAGDADPATFVQSLDALVQSDADSAVALPPVSRDDLSDLSGWLRRRVRWLIERVPPPWSLVLDNHHEMPAVSPLQTALAAALEDLPPGVQWIFISRRPPPSAFSVAISRQQLAIFDAALLRFDDAETQALIALHGRASALATSLAPARGWAAGMTLMLVGSPRDAVVPALEAGERLFDYFADEVFARMPQAERDALERMAYLPAMTSKAAIAISGNPLAADLLERLRAANLFVDRRDGPPPLYAFHDLFRDFLRDRFERVASARDIQDVQRRAGDILADLDDPDAALQRYAEAGAADAAALLIARIAGRYANERRTSALLQHITALPRAERRTLAYWEGFCRIETDPERALADLERAHADGVATADAETRLAAVAGIATVLIGQGRIAALDRWIAMLDDDALAITDTRDSGTESRIVPGLLAMLVYRAPWHPLTEPLAERAERMLHADSAGQHLLLATLAFHLLWRGRVDRLERLLLRIDGLRAQGLAAPATLMRWWSVGLVVKPLLGLNASAQDDARDALSLLETEATLAPQRAAIELLAMFVALAMVDAGRARAHLAAAAQALRPGNAIERTMFEHHKGILALLDDDGPAALRLMRAAVESAHVGGFSMREHIALIAQALAAAHCDEHDEADRLLQQVVSHPFFGIGGWHHWVVGLVAAYAALRRGAEREVEHEVERWLRVALGVARDCGFRHAPMLFCCRGMMPRLLAFALAHSIEPVVARDIVGRHGLQAPSEAGEEWPWDVSVRVLDRLEVEVGGRPLVSPRKESRRLLELLTILATAGAMPVAVDAIVDDMWADAEGDAARNALDNALHRLRKMLGGDDRVVLRHGALMLNPQRCWTDVRAVELLIARLGGEAAHALPALLESLPDVDPAPADAPPGLASRQRNALVRRYQRAVQIAASRLPATESLPDR